MTITPCSRNFPAWRSTRREERKIAETLGPRKAVILQNHGILTVAQSVEGAVWRYLAMENACQVQLLADAAGRAKPMPEAVARHTAGQVGSEVGGFYAFQPYWDVISEEEPDLFGVWPSSIALPTDAQRSRSSAPRGLAACARDRARQRPRATSPCA